jgi:hypothetical protein
MADLLQQTMVSRDMCGNGKHDAAQVRETRNALRKSSQAQANGSPAWALGGRYLFKNGAKEGSL